MRSTLSAQQGITMKQTVAILDRNFLNVPDGYNGATVDLDLVPLMIEQNMVKLSVAGKPWLIRWVRRCDFDAAVARNA